MCNLKRLLICLFINLFVFFSVKSQIIFTNNQCIKADTAKTLAISTKIPSIFFPPALVNHMPIQSVPSSFYYNSLGFFCKKEIQLEKALKFPLKLRIGNITYTDKMEGKITSRITE